MAVQQRTGRLNSGDVSIFYRAFIAAIFAVITYNAPAFALTAKQKMETCKFGADDQKLAGAARKTFISKCMAKDDAAANRAKTWQKK